MISELEALKIFQDASLPEGQRLLGLKLAAGPKSERLEAIRAEDDENKRRIAAAIEIQRHLRGYRTRCSMQQRLAPKTSTLAVYSGSRTLVNRMDDMRNVVDRIPEQVGEVSGEDVDVKSLYEAYRAALEREGKEPASFDTFLSSYEEHLETESGPRTGRGGKDVDILNVTPRKIRKREKPPTKEEAAMIIQRAWRRHIILVLGGWTFDICDFEEMSTYANYNELSDGYDHTRLPNGAQHYLGIVYSLTKKCAENLHLLDIGCGTGNHVNYLLKDGLGRATLLDADKSMLEKARVKLSAFQNRVEFCEYKLPQLPYSDNSFDVVICNQVLHHLTELGKDKDFGTVGKCLEEVFRVLKPNGVFIANLCTPFQALNAFWYGQLYLKSNADFAARLPEPEQFVRFLEKAGFVRAGMIVEPLDMVYTEDRYFNEEGPLDEAWRNADSMSAVLEPEELETATEKVKDLKKEGKLKDFMLDADTMRQHVGQYAIYYAKKE